MNFEKFENKSNDEISRKDGSKGETMKFETNLMTRFQEKTDPTERDLNTGTREAKRS